MKQNSTLDQLWDIYKYKETWHDVYLLEGPFKEYMKKLMEDRNVFVYKDKNKIISYIEIWFVDYEQLDKIVMRGYSFDPGKENITKGKHCYVANIYVDEEHRFNRTLWKTMKKQFFETTADCATISGHKYKYNKKFMLHKKDLHRRF